MVVEPKGKRLHNLESTLFFQNNSGYIVYFFRMWAGEESEARLKIRDRLCFILLFHFSL